MVICFQYKVTGRGQESVYPNGVAFIKPEYPKHGNVFYEDAGFNGTVTFIPICGWKIKEKK